MHQLCSPRFHVVFTVLLTWCLGSRPVSSARKCEVKYNENVMHSEYRTKADYMRPASQKIRITTVYSDNFKRLYNYHHIAATYIEPAVDFWRSALIPKQALTKPLKMRRQCIGGMWQPVTDEYGRRDSVCTYGCNPSQLCYGVPVPTTYLAACPRRHGNTTVYDDHGGYGAQDTDYLVFVDYRQNGCGVSTLAFAIHCQLDMNTDRPEIGMINFCSYKTRFEESNKKDIKHTAIHELAHALGFSWQMIPYMRDDNGEPRTKRDIYNYPNEGRDGNNYAIPNSATGGEMSHWWLTSEKYVLRTTKVLRTPHILAAARAHFNCPSLQGVELEDSGGPGTAASHFEKRLFYDEVMVGTLTGEETVSNLTLAFFKDTGWYEIDTSVASPTRWGKGLGCDFATKSCYYYMSTRPQNETASPWCNRYDQYCPTTKLRCVLSRWDTPLPEQYRYVPTQRAIRHGEQIYFSGNDPLMDFCPYEVKCGRRR